MQKFYLISKQSVFYLLMGLVVFIPLYPKFPLINVAGTYVAIRIEDLLILFVLLVWLMGNFSKLKSYLNQTIYQALLLFWLIGGLSLLSGLLITHSLTPSLGLLHWLRRVEYMSLFIVAATSISSLKQIKWIVYALLFAAAVVIFYGFGQIWLDFPVISTTNREFSKGLILYLSRDARVNSTFAGHYDLAVFLSIILMFIGSLFFYFRNIFFKAGLFLQGCLAFILLGFTAARVSFVTTLAGLALLFLISGKKILVAGLIVLAIGLLAIIPDLRHRLVATITVNLMGGGGAKYTPPPDTVTKFTPVNQLKQQSQAYKDQMIKESTKSASSGAIAVDTAPGEPVNTTELGVYRSFGIRFNVEWPRALRAFFKNPFLGTGYSSLTIATDNDFLRSLGETGLLGTISLGLLFFILFKKMILFIKQGQGLGKYFVLAIFCSTVVLLLTSTFIDVLEASKIAEIFWLLLGVSWATMRNSTINE